MSRLVHVFFRVLLFVVRAYTRLLSCSLCAVPVALAAATFTIFTTAVRARRIAERLQCKIDGAVR